MKRSINPVSGLAALMLLAGCGSGDKDAPVGGISAREAAELDNAAEMLDASPDGLTAPANMALDMESNSGAQANAH